MIELKNVSKIFGENHAVKNVSFKLETGMIGCIIGTSGCGKTTTLKMINRLIEPSSGEVLVDGMAASDEDPINWRRKIGYVIQKAGLLPHLTIKENISILAKIKNRKPEYIEGRVQELMKVVDLPFEEISNRYPKELSGGQQQRVGIARALMENPPVMLMDEPFGALDPITRNSMHDEFYNLNQKLGKTILIVTHDMNEAFKLADKVILMNHGEIVQMGTQKDFIENPANEFVRSFLAEHLNA